jgi:hypothetical protein
VTKLEKFSPAIADLASYLLSAKDNYTGAWQDLGSQVFNALELPIIQHSEYLTVILLDLFAGLPALNHVDHILQKYEKKPSMIQREIVRVATAHKASHWLRQLKEEFPGAGPWLKRALIAGASTFNKDERMYWLQRIEREGTDLEKFVARWAKTAP